MQSYKWHNSNHINVLELAAFLNFVKFACREKNLAGERFFHVLDSRVAACVVAKGRSSSKLLNRLLRRLVALFIVADLYVFPLWTISAWNFADAPSRVFSPAAKPNDG